MNKMKLVPYALALSLSVTSLTSCGSSYSNFSYSVNSEDEFVAEGIIDYNLLKNYKLIELKLLNGENKLYIAGKREVYAKSGLVSIDYTDIFTGKVIYDTAGAEERLELKAEYNLEDYLITYDEMKNSYSIEDVERIYNKILEDYEFESEKTLVNE